MTNTTNGCTAEDLVTIAQDTVKPFAIAGAGIELNCQVPDYQLKSAAPVGANFTYKWTTAGGSFKTATDILKPTVDAPGTYTLLVTNIANGCTATDQVVITQANDKPTVAIAQPIVLTCKIKDQILNGAGSSAGPEFSYLWTASNGGTILADPTTLNPQIGSTGTYQLAVTNTTTQCTATKSVTVVDDVVPPTGDAGPTKTLTCAVTTLQLTATGGGSAQISFLWSTVSGTIVSGGNTATATIGSPGWYNVLITNELNGCTTTDSVEVKADVNLPNAAIAPTLTLTCKVKTVTLDATLGTTTGPNMAYTWSTTNGSFVSKSGLTAIVDQPGSYQLLVENISTGCKTTTSATVPQDVQLPTAVAGSDLTLTCSSPTSSLDGTGSSPGANFTYLWTASNGGNIKTGPTTLNPTIDKPGTYTLVVTNTVNGCTNSDSVVASPDQTAPVAVIAQPEVLTCVKKTVAVDAGGSSSGNPYTLAWTTVGGNFTTGQTTLKPSVDKPGAYNLLITNTSNGCTATATANVTQNIQPPVIDAGPGFQLTCTVLKDKLTATSNPPQVTASWTTLNGSIVGGSATLTPTVDKPGLYSLLVTRTDNGCTAADNTTVTEETNKPSGVEVSVTLPRCDGDVGNITFDTVTGGIKPILYSINGGQSYFTAAAFNSIDPGNYTLMVQDANGCTYSEPLNVPAPLVPTVTALPEIQIELGDSLTLDADLGGFPLNLVDTVEWSPLDYLKFKSLTLPDLLHPEAKPLKSTRYKLLVTSLQGCTGVATTYVKVDKTRHVYIPNAISPWNGDGQNDALVIFADPKAVLEIEAFEVFDRWGDKVWSKYGFQPNDPGNGWGGIVRSQRLDPGVFVYWARIKFIDGKVELYKGDVTLVR